MHNMNILIKHFIPWIIVPLIVYHYSSIISIELFPIVVIGIFFIVFVYYTTQQMIRYTIIPVAAVAISTLVYMTFINTEAFLF